ncbi:MAG: polyketide cyclase / dehydrase and lipid transport [Kineosporiaceae bacterium]
MPVLDITDQAFVACAPAVVRSRPDGPCGLGGWVPGLGLDMVVDRGDEGVLWRAAALDPGGGRWAGTAEVWLQPWHDGTVVHLYVRLDPAGGPAARSPDARVVARWREALRDRWRAMFLTWRHDVDGRRRAGERAHCAP